MSNVGRTSNRLLHSCVLVFIVLYPTRTSSSLSAPSFLHKGRMSNVTEGDEVPFDTSWFPDNNVGEEKGDDDNASCASKSVFPLPKFVDVFDYKASTSPCIDVEYGVGEKESLLRQLGREARLIIDDALDTRRNSEKEEEDSTTVDAVLFRGLSTCIQNAHDFKAFWSGCIEGEGRKEMTYVPFGAGRNTLDGVDLVTPFPPEWLLNCHNEMSYNPRPAGRIAFYCLETASTGGETILARNVDLTRYVSKELQQLVKESGGIIYRREYYDERHNPNPSSVVHRHMGSWQKKVGANDEKAAINFFTSLGFSLEDVNFDKDGTLVVENIHPGFINGDDDTEVWFNILFMGMFKLADGTSIPSHMLKQLKLDEWRAVHALKLHPGDWLVLNNRSVQHGRLPFVDGPDKKRTILTVYTD